MPAEAPAAAASTAAAAAVPERATRSFLLRGSLAAAGAALLAAAVPPAQAAGLPAASAEQVAAGAEGRVASIACIGGGREAALGVQRLGSGLVWDAQGHVVVPYAPLTRAVRASSTYEAQILVTLTAADGSRHELPVAVVARDPSHELIVLQVTPPAAGLRPITAGSTAGLRAGQDALLLGALPDGGVSLTSGVLSALGRVIPASNNQAIPGVLQTDAEVGPQSLGGALLDSAGRVIGMPVVSYVKPGVGRSSGVNFALPIDLLRDVVPKLIVYGSAQARR